VLRFCATVMSQPLKIWKISFLLLLGLWVFLFLAASTITDVYWTFANPAIGISYEFDRTLGRIEIVRVEPDSPAARAGLRIGDVILTYNHLPATSEKGFERALQSVVVDQTVELLIFRGANELKISFVAENPLKVYTEKILLGLLPGAFFCYALSLIAIFVLLKKIQDRMANIFYLMLLFWALAMRDTLELGSKLDSILPDWVGWLRWPSWPLAIGAFLHFCLIFPVENKAFQKRHKIFLILIYLPLILLIPKIYAEVTHASWGGKLLRYGWGIWLTLNFFIAMAVLDHSIRRAPNPYIKKQAQIMAGGTALSLSIPLCYAFLPKLLFDAKLPYAEFTALLFILWPVTLAYVIVKHRFMDIDVIVKKGVAYALMSGFVVAAYFLLVLGVGQLVLFLTDSQSQLVTIIATLLIAALFNPVKNRVQNFVDRRFYPNRFTYREAVRAFGHQLVNVVDLEKLLDLLKSFLFETMRIRPVMLFMRHETAATFIARAVSGIDPENLPAFNLDDKIVKRLLENRQLVDLTPCRERPESIPEAESARWDQVRAELILPLFSKQQLVGILTLGMKEGDEPYSEEDLELLATLVDQINITLENALLTEKLREQDRFKKELEVARRIQLSSLPQADPQISGLDISGISVPALEVGGDYYDYLDFADGRFGVVIGDVSGKGTSAALYMSQLKGMLQVGAKHYRSVKELVVEVNAITYQSITAQSFITLMCAAFDVKSRRLSLVRAGHLPLLHYSATKKTCQQLVPKGIGVGLENGSLFKAELEEIELPFAADDVFLFYTDGITEARNLAGREFETDLLARIVQENGWENAIALREKIIAQVHQFAATASPQDDMTLVVVKAN
jgi:serine phosphatase RsbU (regulator of sigma subunit)